MNPRVLVSMLLMAGAMTGCANPAPQWESRFGDAVRTARVQQTLNPDAGRGPAGEATTDGFAATESIGRYHDSFKAPPPTFEVLFSSGGGR